METATKEGTLARKVTLDVIKYVEDSQRPRETFGEALRRLLFDAGRREDAGNTAS